MQVTLPELYEKTKKELATALERALIAEAIGEKLEKENSDLRLKLTELDGQGVAEAQDPDAYLEKLKEEVKD